MEQDESKGTQLLLAYKKRKMGDHKKEKKIKGNEKSER